MSRHAGPPGQTGAPAVPEPTYAERARTLAYLGRTGALATLSRKHPGHPFASVMPYALDELGQPLVLISAMAMHTQNLQADLRASLLVTQPIAGPQLKESDPLAAARLTLIVEARRLADEPATLEDLSAEFGVSRERIRQIEVRAFEKVQAAVQKSARKDEAGSASAAAGAA